MMSNHPPPISAVICTRNRGISVFSTIETILANTYPEFDVILIDQSTNDESEKAIEPFRADHRFRYIRSTTKGLGRARNIGLSLAQSQLVAFTDDDCTVPPDWLEKIVAAFDTHPQIAVVFCNVEAADHDPGQGFIPAYMRTDSKLVRTFWDKCRARGIGAGIAVQRQRVLSIGGFDEQLGAGARFPSCEDGDMAVRVLAHNWWVYETHEVAVLHYGFRTWKEGQQLTKRDWVGIGAAYAKLVSCGQWGGLAVIFYEALVMGLFVPLSAVFHLRKPQGLRRLPYFMLGFWQGLRTPVDRTTMLFRSPAHGSTTLNAPSDGDAKIEVSTRNIKL